MVKVPKASTTLPKAEKQTLRILLKKIKIPVEDNPRKEIERLKQFRESLAIKLRVSHPGVRAIFNYELTFRYEELQKEAYEQYDGQHPKLDYGTYLEKADCLFEAKDAILDLEGDLYAHLSAHILNYIGFLDATQKQIHTAKLAFQSSISALSRCSGDTEDLQKIVEENLRTVIEQPKNPHYIRLRANLELT